MYDHRHRSISATMLTYMVIGVLPLGSCSRDSTEIGVWLPTKKSEGGVGTSLVLTRAGDFYATIGTVQEFTYQTKGDNELILTPINTPKGSRRYAIQLTSDYLKLADPETKKKIFLKRFTRSPQAGLAGVWVYKDDASGADTYMEFTKSGRHYFFVPMSQYSGTFKSGTATVKIQGQPDKEYRYTVKGDCMTWVSEPGGVPATFLRKK